MNNSLFSSFTNQYSLSKTLRFELKPVGKTQQMLEETKVFQRDETIQKKYEATKPYFDRLHREFVKEALESKVLSELDGYFEIFKKWKIDKKVYEKEIQKKEGELRKGIVQFFNTQGKEWAEKYSGLKNKNIEILFEEAVFKAILKERYENEEGSMVADESTGELVSIFDSWKGFSGYFGKFFETRKNFYKDDGTSTALATRIIDQNLKRFCDNIQIFECLKEKVDFREVEENFGKSLSEIFSINFYNTCFLQDGINFYNKVLGGEALKNGEKLKGLNEFINKYRQDHKGEKLPFFKSLDKQILSEKEQFIDEIENDEKLLDILKSFHKTAQLKALILKRLFEDFLVDQGKYHLEEIYLSKEAINTIFHKWTNETETVEEALYEVLRSAKIISTSAKKKDGGYSFSDFIALSHIKESLEKIPSKKFWKERYYEIQNFEEKQIWEQFLAIFEFEFLSLFRSEKTNSETGEKVESGYEIFEKDFSNLLSHFVFDQNAKIIIKNFSDSILTIYQMAKYFALEKKRAWQTDYELDAFYTNPENGYLQFYENAYEEIVQVYNKLRNYLTKKPYSEEKWKLNFDNPTLADGWDKNKESDNSAVILRKNGEYYLGLMSKGNNKIFDDRNIQNFSKNIEQGKYEKVVYKFFPDQAKMFPKVCFSAKGLEFFQPSEEIWNIYKNAEFKKGETFSINSMQKLIDFYKDCLKKYDGWKGYDFEHLKTTELYQENIGEFFRDVSEDGYKITFQDISESYINEKNQNGELYLFQIKNKDWNEGATGAKNLHTLYFESLFSEENRKQNFPMKLNGQAEIFYRPKTKDLKKEKITTKSGKILEKEEKAFQKNRFTENKIFFHVPLTLNRTKSDPFQFNVKINNFLANNPEINIIGVDRGEKHLAYFSVITQEGKILDSGTLNEITGVNYAEKLEEKAKNREQERKDWQTVEGIKDLKKGYISQVVRKLADLAIQHNAIIVFEDLNMRFKQIRGGIEKSVYQQLEKALIEKLNFLVNKGEKNLEKAGHLLKAYQLAAPFTTFKDMGKQTGIIFYTQAAYTSRIDPITGWRPHLYLKYSSAEKAKADIQNFTKIEFSNGRFEFTYDIKNFRTQKEYPQNTIWTICSSVERFRWNRHLNNNKGGYDHYASITENLLQLLKEAEIDIMTGNILGQIESLNTKEHVQFFKDLIFYINLICQIRNTDDQAKIFDKQDFIFSPVEPFFDSRKSEEFGKDLPKNGDDNGAYNIARKGILVLKKISDFSEKNGGCEKMKWDNLFVSNAEWDNFVSH
ncbi:type V CRISPR-associated protein Cas12a/Cpf1 [Candidatus Peregrinibacteria bacterium]|nr:MAG: type V CRISPR-associated protein Cas12a/Cpf1 [Candidatus Peregrinibacteria bacterium]